MHSDGIIVVENFLLSVRKMFSLVFGLEETFYKLLAKNFE